MASFSYLHAVKMYKEDIVVEDLYFNQVGSCCHKSERVLDYIDKNFPKKFGSWYPLIPQIYLQKKNFRHEEKLINIKFDFYQKGQKNKCIYGIEFLKQFVKIWSLILKIKFKK